jgi:hypothetical protein
MKHSEVAQKLGPAMLSISGSVNAKPYPYGDSLLIPVTVTDYKCVYGKDRWLINPVGGSGERFVETDTLVWEDN